MQGAIVVKNAKHNVLSKSILSKKLHGVDEIVANDLSDLQKLKPKWSHFWGGGHMERESKIYVDKK